MKCPSCGASLEPEQNFCRVCGTTVDPAISVHVTRPSSVPPAVTAGFALLMIGTFIGVIGRMLLENQGVAAVGVLVALGGIFLTVIGSFGSRVRRIRKEDRAGPDVAHYNTELATNKLPELYPGAFPSSVTEKTTDLLAIERHKEQS
jgi:hypothetical protein